MTIFYGNPGRFPAGATLWQPPAEEADVDVVRDLRVAADAFDAAQAAQRFAGNAYSRLAAAEAAIDRRNDAIKGAIGIALDNPYRSFIAPDDRRAKALELGYPASTGGEIISLPIIADRVRTYEERLAQLAQERPDDQAAQAAIRPGVSVEDDTRALAAASERRAGEALAAPSSEPVMKWAGYFAGTMAGWVRDPTNVAQILAGWGGGSAAATIGGAVVRGALREAVVNGAGEAAVQPAVQKWRGELGLEAGLAEGVQNVAMAAAFGGIIGGLGAGIGHALHPPAHLPSGREPAVPQGVPPRGQQEVPLVVRAIGGDDEAIIAAARESGDPVLKAGADAMEADNLARGAPPAGISPDDHGAYFAQALRFAEDPEAAPPPRVAFPEGFTVWHGSPHDFDAFSTLKIGSGEGGNAFGTGLYFAERRGVAEWYRDELTARLSGAEEGGERVASGNLYEVQVRREPDEFLDWDKPIGEQSPRVQAALARIGLDAEGYAARINLRDRAGALDIEGASRYAKGEYIYEAFAQAAEGGADDASKALADAGIAGIRYAEGQARVRGPDGDKVTADAARNYVVFRDDDVSIVAKNDTPVRNPSAPEPAAAAPPEKPRGVLDAYPVGDDATGGARMVTSDALKASGARDNELAAITRACNT